MKRLFKKGLFFCVYLLVVFAFVLFADYMLFRSRVKNMGIPSAGQKLPVSAFPEVRSVRPETLLRLGHLVLDRRSSFVNFDPRKKEGVIRIGCFGDSFTLGDETNIYCDFPAHLQQLFFTQGYADIEVLNFGSSWHGFHQAFILWNEVGRHFGLDYIVLGPGCFQVERDSTFNHTGGVNINYFHSRYVLEELGIRLIDVLGRNDVERMHNYFRFIPRERYLKYDIQAPLFLQSLLPRGRRLKNPFYYHKGPVQEEVYETYRRLLSKMVESGSQVLLCHYDPNIVALGASLNFDNLFSTPLIQPKKFPYLATKTHNSSLGNRVVAKQVYDILTGSDSFELDLLRYTNGEREVSPADSGVERSLSVYGEAAFEMDGRTIGHFVRFQNNNFNNEILRGLPSTSLVVLCREEEDVLSSCFLPVDVRLEEGMGLSLKGAGKEGVQSVPLGTVQLPDPRVNFGIVILPNFDFDYYSKNLRVVFEESAFGERGIQRGESVEVFIGGEEILHGTVPKEGEGIDLITNDGTCLVAGVDLDFDASPDKMEKGGTIGLLLKRGAFEMRIPLVNWELEQKPFPYDRKNCHLIPIQK